MDIEALFLSEQALQDFYIIALLHRPFQPTPWRNGSASDSRSEGCVFESRRAHLFILSFSHDILSLKAGGEKKDRPWVGSNHQPFG